MEAKLRCLFEAASSFFPPSSLGLSPFFPGELIWPIGAEGCFSKSAKPRGCGVKSAPDTAKSVWK